MSLCCGLLFLSCGRRVLRVRLACRRFRLSGSRRTRSRLRGRRFRCCCTTLRHVGSGCGLHNFRLRCRWHGWFCSARRLCCRELSRRCRLHSLIAGLRSIDHCGISGARIARSGLRVLRHILLLAMPQRGDGADRIGGVRNRICSRAIALRQRSCRPAGIGHRAGKRIRCSPAGSGIEDG